jgi:23S rRNA pseudouridine1911/1915/1917 synthase
LYAISNAPRDIPRLLDSLNTIHWKWIVREPERCSRSLKDFFLEHLPHISTESWQERQQWGGVYVNGFPFDINDLLPCPCWIEYYEPKYGLSVAKAELDPLDMNKHLVYEDEWIGVVYKPNRLHTNHAREQSHFSVRSALDAHYGKPVHLPSRLDFSTAGLLAYSHNPHSHGSLQSLFEKRLLTKQYLALGSGKAHWESCVFQGRIGKDSRHAILRDMRQADGKQSLTHFERLAWVNEQNPIESDPSLNNHSLFLATPKTGRTHQIRLHLSSLGYPIVGDNFYGGDVHPHLHLLSFRLELQHPVLGTPLSLQAPFELLPNWAKFAAGAPIT